jgi:hypothetical protein
VLTTPTTTTPQPSKTRIAREVVVAVLVRAGRPMTRSEALEQALADPRVRAAGVSRGTLSAQLASALAEDPPRIIRLCRGIYAAADDEGATDAPRWATGGGATSGRGEDTAAE